MAYRVVKYILCAEFWGDEHHCRPPQYKFWGGDVMATRQRSRRLRAFYHSHTSTYLSLLPFSVCTLKAQCLTSPVLRTWKKTQPLK